MMSKLRKFLSSFTFIFTDVSSGRATGRMDLTMNYQNYEKAIVLVYGVKLDGWPEGLPFLAPSHMHTVLEVRTLRDALVTGACYWKKLNQRELEDLRMDIQRRSDAGEVIGTVRKKRSDAGKTRKRKDGASDPTMADGAKRTRRSRRGTQVERQKKTKPMSAEFIEDSDEEGSIE